MAIIPNLREENPESLTSLSVSVIRKALFVPAFERKPVGRGKNLVIWCTSISRVLEICAQALWEAIAVVTIIIGSVSNDRDLMLSRTSPRQALATFHIVLTSLRLSPSEE